MLIVNPKFRKEIDGRQSPLDQPTMKFGSICSATKLLKWANTSCLNFKRKTLNEELAAKWRV
jgi:hypothetical protein